MRQCSTRNHHHQSRNEQTVRYTRSFFALYESLLGFEVPSGHKPLNSLTDGQLGSLLIVISNITACCLVIIRLSSPIPIFAHYSIPGLTVVYVRLKRGLSDSFPFPCYENDSATKYSLIASLNVCNCPFLPKEIQL